MTDPNALYSHDGLEPTILPHRITLSNGNSRTDVNSFADDEIIDAGFTGPYEKPEYDLNTEILLWDSDSLSYSIVERPSQIQTLTEEQKYEFIRYERNKRLQFCDWTDLPNTPLTPEKKSEWLNYRQELRDLPKNIVDIDNINWPSSPIDSVGISKT